VAAELDEAATPRGDQPSIFSIALEEVRRDAEQMRLERPSVHDEPVLDFIDSITLEGLKRLLRGTGELWKRSVLWLRVKTFQQVTLVRIANELCRLQSGDQLGMKDGPLDDGVKLRPLADGQHHAVISSNNAGAMDLVRDELSSLIDGRFELAYGTDALATARFAHPPVFLLYLDRRTWQSARRAQLAWEVKTAIQQQQPLILIHESDWDARHRHAEPFGMIMRATPPELMEMGIYNGKLAIALPGGEHRRFGLHQVATELQALVEAAATTPSASASGGGWSWPAALEPRWSTRNGLLAYGHDPAGGLVDLGCHLRGLHDAPDATFRGPEMALSQVLLDAVEAAKLRKKEEEEAAANYGARKSASGQPDAQKRVGSSVLAKLAGGRSLRFEQPTLGLKWMKVAMRPETGAELTHCAALAQALQTRLEFTAVELDGFKVGRQLRPDSFVRVGAAGHEKYFKPALKEQPKAKVDDAPDTAAMQERARAGAKDWIGEALATVGEAVPRPSSFTGTRVDVESIPDVLWRAVEPSVVAEVEQWRHKWEVERAPPTATSDEAGAPSAVAGAGQLGAVPALFDLGRPTSLAALRDEAGSSGFLSARLAPRAAPGVAEAGRLSKQHSSPMDLKNAIAQREQMDAPHSRTSAAPARAPNLDA